jgi:hypothetical protein
MFVKRVRFLCETSQTRLPVLYSPRDVHTYLCNMVCEGFFNLSRKKKYISMYNIENTASGVPLQTALHLYYKPTHVYTHALMTTFIFLFPRAPTQKCTCIARHNIWKNCERKVKENFKKNGLYNIIIWYIWYTCPEILFFHYIIIVSIF